MALRVFIGWHTTYVGGRSKQERWKVDVAVEQAAPPIWTRPNVAWNCENAGVGCLLRFKNEWLYFVWYRTTTTVYLQLLVLIGEGFGEDSDYVNGGVVQVRSKGDKTAIWTSDCKNKSSVLHIGWVKQQHTGIRKSATFFQFLVVQYLYGVVQKVLAILLSRSFRIKLTHASVFQVNQSYNPKVLFPSFNGSSNKTFRAGENQDCRGLFRDEISCPNSTTTLEALSRQKRSNQTHSKAPPAQIQGDGKCIGEHYQSKWLAAVSQDRKSHRDCETMFGAVSEEIHKAFVPVETEGLSWSSVVRIMHQDLPCFRIWFRFYNFRPMQIKLWANHQAANQRPSWFHVLQFFSDEANFHLSGHANKQKMRFCAQAQPQEH